MELLTRLKRSSQKIAAFFVLFRRIFIDIIVKKLYNSPALKKAYPKETDRLNHIFEHQVYGLAPTEIIYRIALSYILGFADKKQIKKHNLRHFDTLPSVQNGTLESDLDKLYE